MACKKRMVKFGRWVQKLLTPVLIRRISTVTSVLDSADDDWLSSADKRRLVVEDAKRRYAELNEIDLAQVAGEVDGAIRATLEAVLHSLRDGADPDELGEDDQESVTV